MGAKTPMAETHAEKQLPPAVEIEIVPGGTPGCDEPLTVTTTDIPDPAEAELVATAKFTSELWTLVGDAFRLMMDKLFAAIETVEVRNASELHHLTKAITAILRGQAAIADAKLV